MATEGQPKRRFFPLLRRKAKAAQSPADDNAIWLAFERAQTSMRAAGESSQRISSSLAKERGTADTVADRARGALVRAQELGATFAKTIDAFDRLGLVALNAGLEGARLGESIGRSLSIVSDDVRAQATRGAEAARELSTTLNEIGGEISQLNMNLDRAREASGEVGQEAARIAAAAADADRAMIELAERLRKSTGSDPETARAIADATEHARALVVSLGALSSKMPQELLTVVVRPMLEPLMRLLGDDDENESNEGGARE
jgi:methyl-accepting chemotaxis protein